MATMISIIQQPQVCSLTKNEMIFKVKTDMQYPSERISPNFRLTFSAYIPRAQYIVFSFENPATGKVEDVKITGADVFINPGDIYCDTNLGTATSIAEYVVLCVLELRKITVLNAYYEINSEGNSIVFTAKFPIKELVLTGIFSSHVSVTVLNSPTYNDPNERAGYEMRASVYIEQTHLKGNYTLASDVYCPLDENSEGMIDISDILNADVEAAWGEIPVPATEVQQFLAPNLRRYYVKFTEIWDGEEFFKSKTSAVLYAHWGGISTDDENNDNPISLIASTNDFLTWWESGKRNFENQRDFLSWMNTGLEREFKLRTTIYASDGSTVVLNSFFTLKEFQTITFQTGHGFLKLQNQLPVGKILFKYSFQIIESATSLELNEPFFYYKENTPCIHQSILYWNNFGVPETFVTTGNWSEDLAVSTDMASRGQQFNTSNLRPQNFIFNTKSQNSISAVTQFLTQKEVYRLQVLLTSSLAFVFQNGNWKPIIINSKKAEVLDTGVFLTTIKIEIIRANSTDRTSFYKSSPRLKYEQVDEKIHVKIERNGFVLDVIEGLQISSNEASPFTAPWDATNKRYVIDAKSGVKYNATTNVFDFEGNKYKMSISFVMYYDEFTYLTNDSDHEISFGHTSLGLPAFIDWGVGQTTDSMSVLLATPVVKMYGNTLWKRVKITTPAGMVHVFRNESNSMISNPNFEAFRQLRKIIIDDGGLSKNMYFNNLKQLEEVDLRNMSIELVDFGANKFLHKIRLTNLLLQPKEVERIVENLWNFRKIFQNGPLTLNLSANIGVATARTTAMVNGTGDFAGEGLVTNYLWIVTL